MRLDISWTDIELVWPGHLMSPSNRGMQRSRDAHTLGETVVTITYMNWANIAVDNANQISMIVKSKYKLYRPFSLCLWNH